MVERNFRPLSGNLLSLRSSIRVLTYGKIIIFVPYRGIYFLYGREKNRFLKGVKIFVPYRGIYFLYPVSVWCSYEDEKEEFSSPIGESTFSTLPLEPLCLSGFRSCFAGQNLKIVFLFLFLMLAPLFPLFYAVRRKILFTAGKTLFFPFPYHIIFLDISCICIHAVQLQGLRPLHVYAVHTL